MKTVILAAGFGTRISEETHLKPKPLIEIGGKSILWHIMKLYFAHGINDFLICCGYMGYIIYGSGSPTTSWTCPTSRVTWRRTKWKCIIARSSPGA